MNDKKEVITDRDVLRIYDPIKKESLYVSDDTWQYHIVEEVDNFLLKWHRRNRHANITDKKVILCGHYVNIKFQKRHAFGTQYLITIDTAEFYKKVNKRWIYCLEKAFAYNTSIHNN